MKRIPGMPGTSPEPSGIPGIPWARPMGPPGTPLAPLGPRPWDPPSGPPDTPMDDKNKRIWMNLQRQKLSIAVFEPACWDPSPEALDRSVLSIQNANIKKWGGTHHGEKGGCPNAPLACSHLYVYIYTYIYMIWRRDGAKKFLVFKLFCPPWLQHRP